MKKVKKNIKNIRIILFVLLSLFFFAQKAYTQEISIVTGKLKLSLNERFTISIIFPNDHKKEFKAFHQYFFPDIVDFEKERTLYKDIEAKGGYEIVQYYKPRKLGIFQIPSVRIKIKDKVFLSKEVTVKVISKKTGDEEGNTSYELNDKVEEKLVFEEPKLDVLLELEVNKKEVYSGEGFGVTLSFLISTQNKSEITFIDLHEQRKGFMKKLKATGCLIDEFPMSNEINIDTVYRKDKGYTKWTLFEGVFYSFDSSKVKIPSLNYNVLSYALAKNKQESIERRTILKKFNSTLTFVKIKPLPNSQAKALPIGSFKGSESVSSNRFQTGKSFKYSFSITGEGDIAALPGPIILSSAHFDFYAPKVKQEVLKQKGRVFGTKTYSYYVTPKEPGEFQYSDFIKWPYFNVQNGLYDTLRSALVINVQGESLKNNYISVNNPGDFYSRIDTDSNVSGVLIEEDNIKFWVNILIFAMLSITAIIVFKK